MADSDELEDRIVRLEGLFAVLIASDAMDVDSPEWDMIMHRLIDRPPSSKFPFELVRLIEKYGYRRGTRYRNIDKRLNTVEQRLRSENEELRREFRSYLVAESMGLDTRDVALNRFIPIQVYLPEFTPEQQKRITQSLAELLESFGFEFSDEFPPEFSSWYQKWFAKTKEIATNPEVTARLEKMERALELAQLQDRQADIDKKQAEAVKNAMDAFKDCPNVVSLVGSILIVKISRNNQSNVYTRSLTPEEMIFLSKNQHLLKNPDAILEHLSKCSNSNTEPLDRESFTSLPDTNTSGYLESDTDNEG